MFKSLFRRSGDSSSKKHKKKKEFSSKWKSSIFNDLRSRSKRLRRKAVDGLDSPGLLADIVISAEYSDVKKRAFKKIRESPKALMVVFGSESSKDEKYRRKAMDCLEKLVESIEDEFILQAIAIYASSRAKMFRAVEKIEPPALLADVAVLSREAPIRYAAFERIKNDPDLLIYLISDERLEDNLLRKNAVECLADAVAGSYSPDLLEIVALMSSRPEKRLEAVSKIGLIVEEGVDYWEGGYEEARESLERIAKSSNCEKTRKAALKAMDTETAPPVSGMGKLIPFPGTRKH